MFSAFPLFKKCVIEMQSGYSHLLINLIMIELLGTIFFLAIITICIYIKRYFVRKSLSGNRVLVSQVQKPNYKILWNLDFINLYPDLDSLAFQIYDKTMKPVFIIFRHFLFICINRSQTVNRDYLKSWPKICPQNTIAMLFW